MKEKENPVPSLDIKIEMIKKLLDLKPDAFVSNAHRMLCFIGIRAILQNGVETNNEQPRDNKCTCTAGLECAYCYE